MAGTNLQLFISDEALIKPRALPKNLRQRIGWHLSDLKNFFLLVILRNCLAPRTNIGLGSEIIVSYSALKAARFRCIQLKTEEMRMNSVIEKPAKRGAAPRLTLQSLHRELAELRQRIDELEDFRELNQAIERNGSKPLIPWSKAKKELGLGGA